MDNKKLSQLDLFYRAFRDYKELTSLDLAFNRVRKSSKTFNNVENEDIVLTIVSCKIENDWVEMIEHGIPFMEKCIQEERQFIRSEGDVVPIEKVRKTSKHSIMDLSKHSNYISHLPEDDNANVVPDKLLIINKDNEYAIYENRVLLSCLEYLRDFISIRLNEIKTKMNSYKAKSYINKKLKVGDYSFNYKMELDEERTNDPYAIKRAGIKDIVDRIETCLGSLMAMIKTPLMVEVSKAERVKRPITKTNILRMDHNFRKMLATFDFIADYEGKGYKIFTTEKHLSPLVANNVDDYSELIILSSFITYMYANEIDESLEKEYQAEEKRRKLEKEKEILEMVEEIRNRLGSDKTDAERLLILDQALKIYEEKVEELEKSNKELTIKLTTEVERITKEFELKKDEMMEAHRLMIEKMEEEKRQEIEKIEEEHAEKINKINDEHFAEIEEIRSECRQAIYDKENEIAQRENENDLKIKENEQKMKTIVEESTNIKAELTALRVKNGMGPDPQDLTSKERFDELEKEKMILDRLFEKSWRLTKKDIRRRLFSEKPPKKVRYKK